MKIKRLLKYIIPIVLIVGVVIFNLKTVCIIIFAENTDAEMFAKVFFHGNKCGIQNIGCFDVVRFFVNQIEQIGDIFMVNIIRKTDSSQVFMHMCLLSPRVVIANGMGLLNGFHYSTRQCSFQGRN